MGEGFKQRWNFRKSRIKITVEPELHLGLRCNTGTGVGRRWSKVARKPKMEQRQHIGNLMIGSLHFEIRDLKQIGAGLHLDGGGA